jgi:sortase A
LGIVLLAVPFFIRQSDKNRAEEYIEQFEESAYESDKEETEKSQETTDYETEKTISVQDGAIGIIEIESINLKYPIFEGAGSTQLNEGIGHLTDTAKLLSDGNCVLAGHNGSRRGVFFTHLNQIQTGAEVKITNKEKRTHTYIVESTYIAGPYDETVTEKSDKEYLTLFTCANRGTQRFVVRCIPQISDETEE